MTTNKKKIVIISLIILLVIIIFTVILKPSTIADKVKIGDYINYVADTNNSYMLNKDITGDYETDGTKVTPEHARWRVWDIKEDGTVIIAPETAMTEVTLRGSTGFINGINVIENVCDIYANEELYGVSATDIRSMKLEDLEDTNRSSNIIKFRDNFEKDSDTYPQYGETNVEQYGNNGYTEGIFYTEEDSLTITSTPRVASETNPIVLKQTYYNSMNEEKLYGSLGWNSLQYENPGQKGTYGNLLQDGLLWLASPCVKCYESGAWFGFFDVSSNIIDAESLVDSDGHNFSSTRKVCPLISLSPSLKISGGNGKAASTAWEITK